MANGVHFYIKLKVGDSILLSDSEYRNKLITENIIENKDDIKDVYIKGGELWIVVFVGYTELVSSIQLLVSVANHFMSNYNMTDFSIEFEELDNKGLSEIMLYMMSYMSLSFTKITSSIANIEQHILKNKEHTDTHFATLNKSGCYELQVITNALINAFEANNLKPPELNYNITHH